MRGVEREGPGAETARAGYFGRVLMKRARQSACSWAVSVACAPEVAAALAWRFFTQSSTWGWA